MQTVSSADGTEIAYETHGQGPPLVLLHGGSADRGSWKGVVQHLAETFTPVVPDRRGRGASGDSEAYSLDREIDDLVALCGTVEGAPVVVGHSFGGLVALAAVQDRPLAVDGLVLYEPAILVGEHRGDDLADRMAELLAAGDRRGAMRQFYEETGAVPNVAEAPWWPGDAPLDRAETVVRENRAVEAFALPEDPAVDVPTLLLVGECGPAHLRDAVSALGDRLPDSRTVELAGVGHLATHAAPDRLAAAIREFDGESDGWGPDTDTSVTPS